MVHENLTDGEVDDMDADIFGMVNVTVGINMVTLEVIDEMEDMAVEMNRGVVVEIVVVVEIEVDDNQVGITTIA